MTSPGVLHGRMLVLTSCLRFACDLNFSNIYIKILLLLKKLKDRENDEIAVS